MNTHFSVIMPTYNQVSFIRRAILGHIYSHVSVDTWTKEFSQYDAGWLHCFKSCDNSDFERLDVGIFFHDFYELSNKLKEQMKVKHLFFKEAIRIKKQQIYG
jgi:hypothetical protein